jgi:E1-E2 ATPase
MRSIRSLIADDATVIRNGENQTIPASDLLVGDVVKLQIGKRVPADLRIVEASADLRFDRSLLTGERYTQLLPFSILFTKLTFLIKRFDSRNSRPNFRECPRDSEFSLKFDICCSRLLYRRGFCHWRENCHGSHCSDERESFIGKMRENFD